LYMILIARFAFQPAHPLNETGVALAALNAILFGSVFLLWYSGRLSKNAMSWSVIALALFEIGNVTGSQYKHREQGWTNLNRLWADRDVAGFLKDHLGDGRFDVNSTDLPFNMGDWDGLDQYNGYTGVTANIVGIAFDANSRRLFGVRYYVSVKPRLPGQNPVLRGASGLNVFEEPEPFPRAWSVKQVDEVRDDRLFPTKLAISSPDQLKTTGFLSRDKPDLDVCDGEDAIAFRKVRATSYRLDVDMRCKRMVIVGNTYFPGWIVRVDGRETRMYEVDRALQGFVVPTGKHRVEVSYQPKSVYAGAALSIAGLLGVCALGFVKLT
jgi:Bacterial membrane protein YfhO